MRLETASKEEDGVVKDNRHNKSFLQSVFHLLRAALSDRRAAGSRWNFFMIGFYNSQTKPLGGCRLLRGGNL